MHNAHSARAAAHRGLQKLEESTAPHAPMPKAMKAKDMGYRAAVSHQKEAPLKKLVAFGGDGVHRAMSKASGTSARGPPRFMGGSATLKWRGHDPKSNGRAEVAAGVSKFTAKVSAGDDLTGDWGQGWEGEGTAANDRTSQQVVVGPSPTSNSSYNAAIKVTLR